MTAFPTYSTGTVAVANGATSIVGAGGANWTGANAKPGDDIVVDGHTVVVLDVTDATHLAIDAWPFTTVSAGASYKIIKRSPLRFVGGDAMADVSRMIGALETTGFYVFVAPDLTNPDPSYGAENQFAFQPSTSKLWLKTGGAWVLQGIFKGFNITGAWSGATAYAVNDVVNLSGSSYVCILAHTNHTPPNATYWVVLAAKGDTGPSAWSAPTAWLTATAYVAGPPASVVTQGGETYVCLVSHTSGTFATDLAAAKWIKVSAKGTDGTNGAGYGGTSATSLTIGTGSKVFTTQAGLAYTNGARVRASSTANTSNWMEGLVTYSGTTLTMTSDKTNGSGTIASWNFNVVGQPGAGDLTAANNLSDLANAATARTNLGVTAVGSAVVGHIPGEPSNGNAASGEIGEIIEYTLGSTGLTSGAATVNLANGAFPAGDWEITAYIGITAAGATSLTNYTFSVSSTSATHDTSALDRCDQLRFAGGWSDPIVNKTIGPHRRSLSGSTPLYLTAGATFSNILSVGSKIRGRRIR